LNELRASFGEKGLRILAISNEPASKVEPFIAEQGITYTVGLSTDALSVYGGGGIPHAYLIGPDGVVLWEGNPHGLPKDEVERALKSTFTLRAVAPELKAAATAFEKGKLSEAKSLAEAAKAKGGREVEADADYILGKIAEIVAAWQQDAAKADADPIDVLESLAMIQKHYPGTVESAAAAASEKELRANPAVQKELDAWKKLDKLIADVKKAEGDPKKLKPIQKKIALFIEANGSSKAAKRAQQLLAATRKQK
jgi:hypothetical protein